MRSTLHALRPVLAQRLPAQRRTLVRSLTSVASLAVALHATACGGDEPVTIPYAYETVALDGPQQVALQNFAVGISGRRDASVSAAQLANIGPIPATAVEGSLLYSPGPGGRTAGSVDVDGDGAAESVEVFVRRDNSAVVAWGAADRCRVSFATAGVHWYVDAPCAGTGGLVCKTASALDATTPLGCKLCDADYCVDCEVEARDVRCPTVTPPPPEPDVAPDVEADAGEDAGTVEDTGNPEDTDDVEDTGGIDDTREPDAIDSSTCNPTCMELPGAVCCGECGCAEVPCRPQCREGFAWDCEQTCCADIETFACDNG